MNASDPNEASIIVEAGKLSALSFEYAPPFTTTTSNIDPTSSTSYLKSLQPPPPSHSTDTPAELASWRTWLETYANWPTETHTLRLESVTRVRDHLWTDAHKFAEAAAAAPQQEHPYSKRQKHGFFTRAALAVAKVPVRLFRKAKPQPRQQNNNAYIGPPHFEEIFLYHGTHERNIKPIIRKGYRIGYFGRVFCSPYPTTSFNYTQGGGKMLLNSVLVDQGIDRVAHEISTTRVQTVVPIAVIEFWSNQQRR
ncbi:hypothetical protein HK097_002800 [Rhizophlyctis rosea]|uniref:PARP catalytic domain-containing protein n=1 Tax=Rhizophlyctis rosea TaxID=64517 RepID=A0AAD5S406_9FUNG|nr:hypothetical protein HK097_002800 [Rhizophlyctis rosea]